MDEPQEVKIDRNAAIDDQSEVRKVSRSLKLRSTAIFGVLFLVVGWGGGVGLVTRKAQEMRSRTAAAGIPLTQVATAVGASSITYGLAQYPAIYREADLSVTNPMPGVYELTRSSTSFPCTIGSKNGNDYCEPDRYEVRFSGRVNHVFGLERQPMVNQVEVEDFLDTSFGYGHVSATRKDGKLMEGFDAATGRSRLPLLVFPERNTMMFYMQPDVKILRLTRDGKYGCPAGKTCVVMKKHYLYPEGKPEKLVIIKASNLTALYQQYYSYLRSIGRDFKEPNFMAFGNNWQTFGEFGCFAVKDDITRTVNLYLAKRIRLSTVTIGSGYWNSAGLQGCGGSADTDFYIQNLPATDTLAVNQARYGGLTGIRDLFGWLNGLGIYPTVGMRHRVMEGAMDTVNSVDYTNNVLRVANEFKNKGYADYANYLVKGTDGQPIKMLQGYLLNTYVSPPAYVPAYHYFMDTSKQVLTQTWIDLITEKYGSSDKTKSFRGMKHDDWVFSDQRGFYQQMLSEVKAFCPGPKCYTYAQLESAIPTANLRDDYGQQTFKTYADYYRSKYGQDFLIWSNSSWFSFGVDGEEMEWLKGPNDPVWGPPASWNQQEAGYTKFYVDLALNRIMSGSPQSNNNDHGYGNTGVTGGWWGSDVLPTTSWPNNPTLQVRYNQIVTFHPVTRFTGGWWHIKKADRSDDINKQNVVIWYMQLRERLHQYVYDQAKRWYETGVPWAMQPLMFRFQNDPEVYKQYEYIYDPTDQNTPRDEYMFGNALLVRPVFCATCNTVSVYFPEGKWRPLVGANPVNRRVWEGSRYATYPMPTMDSSYRMDYPVFLKEGEILLIGDQASTPLLEPTRMWAYVFFEGTGAAQSAEYWYYPKAGGNKIRLQAFRDTNNVVIVRNLNNGRQTTMTNDDFGKGFKVAVVDGILQ